MSLSKILGEILNILLVQYPMLRRHIFCYKPELSNVEKPVINSTSAKISHHSTLKFEKAQL